MVASQPKRFEVAPHQWWGIYGAQTPIRAIIGGKGSSKTMTGFMFVHKQIQEQPHADGIITLNTVQQVRDIYWESDGLQDFLLSLGYSPVPELNKNEMILTVGGVRISLRSADTYERFNTLKFGWGWSDELQFYSKEAMQTINDRIRADGTTQEWLITAMPDDPSAFMYRWLDQMQAEGLADYVEIGLNDNPNAAFRERYRKKLKAQYAGAELERYLDGKRVSLNVAGRVLASFGEHNKIPCEYQAGYPLYLMLDFNKRPMTGTLWQMFPKSAVLSAVDTAQVRYADTLICQIDEYAAFPVMREIYYEESADWLIAQYPTHNSEIYLGGDVVGKYSQQGTGVVPYDSVKDKLYKHFGYQRIYEFLPNHAPSVEMSAEKANKLFLAPDNTVSMIVSPRCQFSVQSYAGSRWKVSASGRQIDKTIDQKATFEVDAFGKTVSTSPTTHPQDTCRYLAEMLADELEFQRSKNKSGDGIKGSR